MNSLLKIVISLNRTCSTVDVILTDESFFAFLMSSSSAKMMTSIATSIDFFHEVLLCFHSMIAR